MEFPVRFVHVLVPRNASHHLNIFFFLDKKVTFTIYNYDRKGLINPDTPFFSTYAATLSFLSPADLFLELGAEQQVSEEENVSQLPRSFH